MLWQFFFNIWRPLGSSGYGMVIVILFVFLFLDYFLPLRVPLAKTCCTLSVKVQQNWEARFQKQLQYNFGRGSVSVELGLQLPRAFTRSEEHSTAVQSTEYTLYKMVAKLSQGRNHVHRHDLLFDRDRNVAFNHQSIR